MARAHRIYIVKNLDGAIEAAFTVKHECQSWLRLIGLEEIDGWLVIALRDGGGPGREGYAATEFIQH